MKDAEYQARLVIYGGDQPILCEHKSREEAIEACKAHCRENHGKELIGYGDLVVLGNGFSYYRFKLWFGEYMIFDEEEFAKLPRAEDNLS